MAFGGLENHAKSFEKTIAKGAWNRKRLGTEFWTISGWIRGPFWHPKPTQNDIDFAIDFGTARKTGSILKSRRWRPAVPPFAGAWAPLGGDKGGVKSQ